MEFNVVGENSQSLHINLRKGEKIIARKGSLIYTTPTISFSLSQLDEFFLLTAEEHTSLGIGLTTVGVITPIKLDLGSEVIVNKSNVIAFTDKIYFTKLASIENYEFLHVRSTADNQYIFVFYRGDMLQLSLENTELWIDPDNFVAAFGELVFLETDGLKFTLLGEKPRIIVLKGNGRVLLQTITF